MRVRALWVLMHGRHRGTAEGSSPCGNLSVHTHSFSPALSHSDPISAPQGVIYDCYHPASLQANRAHGISSYQLCMEMFAVAARENTNTLKSISRITTQQLKLHSLISRFRFFFSENVENVIEDMFASCIHYPVFCLVCAFCM